MRGNLAREEKNELNGVPDILWERLAAAIEQSEHMESDWLWGYLVRAISAGAEAEARRKNLPPATLFSKMEASPTTTMKFAGRNCGFAFLEKFAALLTKPLGCDTQGFAVRDASRITPP